MERKDFLKLAGTTASLAFLINNLPVSTYANHPLLQLLAKQTQANGRVLVLIQLVGGNDGINTIIPLDQYSALMAARPNVIIPENKVLPLSGTNATGLHPAMGGSSAVLGGIQNMYNNGLVNIVQGVSYPNPNFSHFRATDIWVSASEANDYLNSGWIGRYLDDTYPGYPTAYPNSSMPDPLAIQIGTGVSTVLQGADMNLGMAIPNIDSFYNIVNSAVTPAPNTPGGHELTFLRYISQETQTYTGIIQNAANNAQNLSTNYPTSNPLADQLKIVARLIAGGLQTPVYVVSLGGFDTHASQVDGPDHTTGVHANLLKQLSDAVAAFYDDLHLLNVDDRVAAMTFSEFGRRIKSNASGGTDHGTAEPVMVFGPGVNPGFIGTNPVIPQSANVNDNLPMQHDYRSIYAAVLADWFQVPPQVLSDVLLQNFSILPVFRNGTTSVNETTTVSGRDEILSQNYPNPVTNGTTITFSTSGGMTTLQLFDASGRLVKTLVQQEYVRGTYEITFNRASLPSGNYFYRLTTNKEQSTRQMTIMN